MYFKIRLRAKRRTKAEVRRKRNIFIDPLKYEHQKIPSFITRFQHSNNNNNSTEQHIIRSNNYSRTFKRGTKYNWKVLFKQITVTFTTFTIKQFSTISIQCVEKAPKCIDRIVSYFLFPEKE